MTEPLDLVCFYTDFGRPYLPLIKRMTDSARAVMPDCKLTLLTATPSDELCGMFDQHVWMKVTPSAATLCYDKIRAFITWQGQIKRPMVLVDPDIEFRRPLIFPADADVGVLWRGTTAYPINSGMIFARPGSKKFWERCGNICASLPSQFYAWWSDQLALAILIGDYHKAGDIVEAYDARVKLMPCDDVCAKPDRVTENTWAIHYKGARKGTEFEEFFARGRKSGVGKLSLVHAS